MKSPFVLPELIIKRFVDMEAVKDYNSLPKFLRVNANQTGANHNKFLLRPYLEGEIVRVQPAELQKPNRQYDHLYEHVKPITDDFFRARFCAILRKDDNGKFSIPYTIQWRSLDLMKKVSGGN